MCAIRPLRAAGVNAPTGCAWNANLPQIDCQIIGVLPLPFRPAEKCARQTAFDTPSRNPPNPRRGPAYWTHRRPIADCPYGSRFLTPRPIASASREMILQCGQQFGGADSPIRPGRLAAATGAVATTNDAACLRAIRSAGPPAWARMIRSNHLDRAYRARSPAPRSQADPSRKNRKYPQHFGMMPIRN